MPPDLVIQLQSRLASISGLPEDVCENVIHMGCDSPFTNSDITDAMEAFRDFYLANHGAQTSPLASYISETISRASNACQILAYANATLDGTAPFGSPLFTLNFTMGAATAGSALPEEVAAVCSYNADLTDVPVSEANPTPPPATIRPAQRRRGRLFLGPLQAPAGTESGLMFRPSTTFRTNLGLAFQGMANEINALGSGLYLGVWSKADADVWEAVAGYVDDAWDTQRRRGLDATTRTAFTIP